MENLSTRHGKNLDRDKVYLEHPNPYFERKAYMPLNGEYDFSIGGKAYDSKILVPFAVETSLSGINRHVGKDDVLRYRKAFEVPDEYMGMRMRLCFTFVDQVAKVSLNGKVLGSHEGGYEAFSFYVDEYGKSNVLEVEVKDDTDSGIYPRGKQSNNPGGIWYTPTSGIYGPVYLEFLPKDVSIEKLLITPDLEGKTFRVRLDVRGRQGKIKLDLYHEGELVSSKKIDKGYDGVYNTFLDAVDHDGRYFLYDLDRPEQYRVVVSYEGDEVSSYTALRKVSMKEVDGYRYVAINDNPVFVHAVLDQGYYPESGLTPPSYEAMEEDIMAAKKLGFNCLRKHIKIEVPRFYYLCEKCGVLVSQDFVNGGDKYHGFLIVAAPFLKLPISDTSHRLLGRKSKESREFFEKGIGPMMEYLHNATSIFMYTVFNEGWGQFDSVRLTEYASAYDPSRLIDSTSGWFDKGAGHFKSRHIYFRRARLTKGKDRILSLSEFGGYAYRDDEHSLDMKAFAYKNFKDLGKYNDALEKLYEKDVIRNIKKKGLAMAVYTQLTDVEGEVNGLLTYDRLVYKVDKARFKDLSRRCYNAFKEKVEKHSGGF